MRSLRGLRGVLRALAGAAFTALLVPIAAAGATIDLGVVLGNSGFENGDSSQWTETKPNASYIDPVPVDPVIQPLDPNCTFPPGTCSGTLLPALTAPDGIHFVGVPNTTNTDPKGKLAHDVLATSYAAGTEFEVLVWGNRGKLGTNGNLNPFFPGSTPQITVQLRGWGAGSVPTVNPANDNWSRAPLFTQTLTFTNWGLATDNGTWRSELFTFTPGLAFEYVTLSISGMTNNHDQYVAFDIAAVPEPSIPLLLGLGLFALAARRRFPKV